jgi:putative lipoprotein
MIAAVCALSPGCGADEQREASGTDSTEHAAGQPDTTETAPGTITPDPTGEIFRGYLVIEPERRSFKACGTNEQSWIVDLTGRELVDVYESLAINQGDPVFVEVFGVMEPPPSEGFGADYANQIKVLELRRAALEGPGCNEDLRSVEFRARGNEPFWSAEISQSGIVFSDFGRSQKLIFPYVRPTTSPGRWTYTSSIAGTERHRIEILVEENSCTDTMSGAYFTFVVDMVVDGRTYTGCAMKGWQE